MRIIIGIIVLVVLFVIISFVRAAGRGHKIAFHLHSFVNVYQTAIRSGAPRDQALRDALQYLRQAPRFDGLTDDDISMIARTLADLREPERLIEKVVMKFDSSQVVQMLKDSEFVSKIGEAKRRDEEQ